MSGLAGAGSGHRVSGWDLTGGLAPWNRGWTSDGASAPCLGGALAGGVVDGILVRDLVPGGINGMGNEFPGALRPFFPSQYSFTCPNYPWVFSSFLGEESALYEAWALPCRSVSGFLSSSHSWLQTCSRAGVGFRNVGSLTTTQICSGTYGTLLWSALCLQQH